MVKSVPTKRWTLTLLKIRQAFRRSIPFWKIFGNQRRSMWGSYSWLNTTRLYTSPCRVGNSWGFHVYDGYRRTNEEMDSHTTKIRRAFRRSVPFWKILEEPMLVDVRVILLVGGDTMGEYLHPRIKLETLGAFMYLIVKNASTKRWTFTLPKFDEPFGARFHFEKFQGNRCRSMWGSYP